MQDFFEEFELYVKRNYGERHFFKNLLEDAVKPLHDSLAEVTKDDILESLFGDVDISLDKLNDALNSISNNNSNISNVNQTKEESGLSDKPINVHVTGIDKSILDALSFKNKNNTPTPSSGGVGVGLGAGILGAGIGAGAMGLFGEGGSISESVKSEIETLLSIGENTDLVNLSSKMTIITGGLLALGAGLLQFSVGKGLASLAEFGNVLSQSKGGRPFAEAIKSDVETLLTIGEVSDLSTVTKRLGEGGIVIASLIGLGYGLTAFSAGKGLASLAEFGNVLSQSKGGRPFAEAIKSDVETLLTIGRTGGFWDGLVANGKFVSMMTGLSAGLVAFSIGKGVATGSEVMAQTIQIFSKEDFADRIKRQVETLLSITSNNSFLDGPKFGLQMGAISAGLVAFSLGKGLNVGVDTVDKVIGLFSGEDFSDRIKRQVETLLSIGQGVNNPILSNGQFYNMMQAIGAGLSVFGIGKGIEGGVSAFNSIKEFFTDDKNYSNRIVSEVNLLLSMGNTSDLTKALAFKETMSILAEGLMLISKKDFISSLTGIGTNLVNKISGKDSPMEMLLSLAENGDKLRAGVDSIESLGRALSSLGDSISTNIPKLNFSDMSKHVEKIIPLIRELVNDKFKGEVTIDHNAKVDFIKTKSTIEDTNKAIKSDKLDIQSQREQDKRDLQDMLNEVATDIATAVLMSGQNIVEVVASTGSGGDNNNITVINTPQDNIRTLRNKAFNLIRQQ